MKNPNNVVTPAVFRDVQLDGTHPERRVFSIDVGNMPPQRIKQHLEQIKNDLRQKRTPNLSQW